MTKNKNKQSVVGETRLDKIEPVLQVVFFRTDAGNEPVREWLLSLPKEQRQTIGEDIKSTQYKWPIGLPLTDKLINGIWEVRSNLPHHWARVLFHIDGDYMVLLNGVMKKTNQTAQSDLDVAKARLKQYLSEKQATAKNKK